MNKEKKKELYNIPDYVKNLTPEEAWCQGHDRGYGKRCIEEIEEFEKKRKENNIPMFVLQEE